MRCITYSRYTNLDVEFRIMKPNNNFDLSVRDIEVIESALRAKAGRRGMAIAQGDTSTQLHSEMTEIQALLGRIHDQKVWYRPKGKFVSGQASILFDMCLTQWVIL